MTTEEQTININIPNSDNAEKMDIETRLNMIETNLAHIVKILSFLCHKKKEKIKDEKEIITI